MAPPPPMGPSASARRNLLGGRIAPSDADIDATITAGVSDPRSGSTLAAGARPNASISVEPRALNAVMSELRTLGAADPAVQAKLIDDLQRTDPSLWPLVTQSYRDTLAYKNRTGGSTAATGSLRATATARAAQPGIPPEAADARTASTEAAAQSAPLSPHQSPWSALAVPAAAQADQIVLKDATVDRTASTSLVAPPTATAISATPAPLVASAGSPLAPLAADATPAGSAEPPLLPATISAAPIASAAPAAPAAVATSGRSPIEQASYSEPASAGSAVLAEFAPLTAALAAIERQATMPDGAARAAAARQQLTEAADRLAAVSPLALAKLTFCSEVASYGVIIPFAVDEFAAGQQVLLYAEVENFKSEPLPQGFRTALQSSYQIFDAQGNRVAGAEPQLMEEVCHNPRRDYFVRYRLNLPQSLAVGPYTLQLAVSDTLTQKSATSSIRFTIIGKQ